MGLTLASSVRILTPCGAPATVIPVDMLLPYSGGETVTVKVPEPPLATESDLGLTEMVRLGAPSSPGSREAR